MRQGNTARRAALLAAAFACAAFAAMGIAGCATGADSSSSSADDATEEAAASFACEIGGTAAAENIAANSASMDFDYSKRDADASYDETSATKIAFSDGGATVDGEGAGSDADADGSTATVSAAGTYIVSGSCADGQLVVDAGDEDKVQIVLSGLTLTCEDGPCIYVKNADKVFITLADGSQNTLSDGSGWELSGEDGEANATIYSKSDLAFNGSGALAIDATVNHAVNSRDDLVICGGSYTITAQNDGLLGKDCVKIKDGSFVIAATEGDGIKSSNSEEADRGFVAIDGGTFQITSGDEGIQAARLVRIAGGALAIDAADDGVNSDIDIQVTGGETTIDAGDDGMHGEYSLEVAGGTVLVQTCTEGLEAQALLVSAGDVTIYSSDDGLNASQGGEDAANDSPDDVIGEGRGGEMPEMPDGDFTPGEGEAPEGFTPGEGDDGTAPEAPGDMGERDEGLDLGSRGGMGGQDGQDAQDQPSGDMDGGGFGGDAGGGATMPDNLPQGDAPDATQPDDGFQANGTNASLTIAGGTVRIVNTRDGDGVDSNGTLEVTGGVLLVSGTSSDGNSAIDYETSAVITGGTVLAIGSAGMAETFGSDSTQASIVASVSGSAGDLVSVTDAEGNVIVSFTSQNSFDWICASAPGIADGETYSIVVGGENADADELGFATTGTVDGGSKTSATASTEQFGGGMGSLGGGTMAQPGNARGNEDNVA